MVALVIAPDQILTGFGLGQWRQTFAIKNVDRLRSLQSQVTAPRRRLRNVSRQTFIEPRLHDITLVVLDVITPSFCVLDPQDLALRRANTDRKNLHAGLTRFL